MSGGHAYLNLWFFGRHLVLLFVLKGGHLGYGPTYQGSQRNRYNSANNYTQRQDSQGPFFVTSTRGVLPKVKGTQYPYVYGWYGIFALARFYSGLMNLVSFIMFIVTNRQYLGLRVVRRPSKISHVLYYSRVRFLRYPRCAMYGVLGVTSQNNARVRYTNFVLFRKDSFLFISVRTVAGRMQALYTTPISRLPMFGGEVGLSCLSDHGVVASSTPRAKRYGRWSGAPFPVRGCHTGVCLRMEGRSFVCTQWRATFVWRFKLAGTTSPSCYKAATFFFGKSHQCRSNRRYQLYHGFYHFPNKLRRCSYRSNAIYLVYQKHSPILPMSQRPRRGKYRPFYTTNFIYRNRSIYGFVHFLPSVP